ncbi:MAG: amidohydrolase [Candidatus Woesearchaeota archaeon]
MVKLITNAYIITMDNSSDKVRKGEVLIQDGVIQFVGEKYQGNLHPEEVIDLSGKVIMPGFINAHTHTPMTLLRNYSDNTNLKEWLFESVLPIEKKLDKESVYYATLLGIFEYLKNGITTFADMYYFEDIVAQAAYDSGIRAVISLGYHPNQNKSKDEIENQYLNLVDKYKERISFLFFNHSIYANNESQFENIISLSKKYNLPVYTHMSESLDEVSDCTVKNNNLTPPALLEKYGYFDNNAIVAHATHLDPEDISILKQYNVNVVTNPASNLKLGNGVAPLYSLHNNDINIAIGTDGAASNNALDMFKEMYLASVLQKSQMRDASAMPSDDILKMATINGAKALGINSLGKIKKGYKADIIAIDLDDVNLRPINNIKNSIVYSANPSNIYMTMINGKILYRDNKFYINKKEKEVIFKIQEKLKNLKNKKEDYE